MATSTPTAPVFPYTGDPLSIVQVDFIGYFGRAAAATGANFWETQLIAGGSTQAAQVGIAAGFSVQAEATTLYPFLASPLVSTPATINSFVNAVFMNLFGHPQATGATYWPTQLQNTLTAAAALSGVAQTNFIANAVGQFIYDIALGAQAADQAVLTAKVTVANYFTLDSQTYNVATPVGSPAWTEAVAVVSGVTSATQVAAAEAAIDAFFAIPTPGQTFTLTTAPDLIPGLIGSLGTSSTAGNDIIIGQNIGAAATWTMNPADQINGGLGVNTFKLYADGTGIAGATAIAQFPTLTSIQNLWINHLGTYATAPTAFDITGSKFASVTSLQLDDLGGGANTIAWIKLAHQSLTISGDSGYGGNIFIIQSAVDTSENVTFSGAGKSTVHDLVAVAGTNAAGSADTGLTISSTGAANFADYDSFGFNSLGSITFAHSVAGDTAFTGINIGSATVETTDASAFTAALTLGTVGATPLAVATGFGDSGSGSPNGDTVKLGSGTTYFAEHIVANGSGGDNFTLLAGHTAIDTLDSTATSSWLWNNATTYSSLANDVLAMSTVTNFNLGNGAALSGDVLKMGYVTPGEAVGTFTDIGTAGLINGHQYANVGTGTGIVAATGVTTAAAFEADVAAAATTSTDGHVIAAVFGGNTYIAEIEWNGMANHVQFIELVGVVATSVSLTGGVAGSIHIA